jgi:hypothetical protein
MAMNNAYLEALATAGKALITHIALLDSEAAEVGDARKAVTWGANDGDGDFLMSGDLEFTMTSGDDVASWCGYSDLTAGTAYGGAALTPVSYSNDGTYTLTAASTGISHSAS